MSGITIDQALQNAIRFHQAGRLPEAEGIYRQILSQVPHHADSLHLLGVIAHQVGRNDVAVDLIRQAIGIQPNLSDAYNNLGNALQSLGRHDEAITSFRQAVRLKPQYPEAWYNLGNVLQFKGFAADAVAACREAIAQRPNYAEAFNALGNSLAGLNNIDGAIEAYHRALSLNAGYPEAHYNLANVLQGKGMRQEAIASWQRAIALRPDFPEAYNNLGGALESMGRFDDAIAAYERAIAIRPDFYEAFNNLGGVLEAKGRTDQAIASYRRAIAIRPNFFQAHYNLGTRLQALRLYHDAVAAFLQAAAINPNAHEVFNNLGTALQAMGRMDESIAAYRRAIGLKPDFAEAHSNLGNALKDMGQMDEAVEACQRAVALRPDLAVPRNNLGNALRELGRLDEAVEAYRQAIALQPELAAVHNNLGNTMKDQALMSEAVASYRQAIALDPQFTEAHSNLIFALHHHPEAAGPEIGKELREWSRHHAEPLKKNIRPHTNDRNMDRPLRVAFVSPDLREHPVARFLLPFFEQCDKSQYQLFAYALSPMIDTLTTSLRSCTAGWRNWFGVPDESAADMVRADRIDILIDLAMHTSNHRLTLFARRPAPVQATYLAYCSSTGLDTIDYRLSDPYLDPPGADRTYYSEQTVYLPDTYWCYQPSAAAPAIIPPPAADCGYVTFGCLNNFAKVSDPTLSAWELILQQSPRSRLMLYASEGRLRQRVHERFECAGISRERIEFVSRKSIGDYMGVYRKIDIALDPFPYGGGTTSCDGLWMGVPLVTWAGDLGVSRGGLSILSNIGLPELVAQSRQQYVELATGLAADIPRLCELRSTLRSRMQASTLMDVPRFTRNMEAALRQMWRTWCASQA